MPPAPFMLSPVLLPKVWGGRRLVRLGKAVPDDVAIGESWELADLGKTSQSGAGGQAIRSVIADGPLAGRTLSEAAAAMGRELMGNVPLTGEGGFPLLVKFLDASDNLSVQVHPSPEYAAAMPGAHLKTESWYIIDAEADAGLYIGCRPGVSSIEFAAAARSQSRDLIGMLNRVAAVPGECHTLPSGTVHALGAGVTVAEVQTPSDTTFRLYDWGRAGRELHIEAALASMGDPGIGKPERASLAEGALCGRLASTRFYTIDEARPQSGDELTIGYACGDGGSAPFVLIVIGGTGVLRHSEDGFDAVPVGIGQTFVVPAASARQTRLHAGDELRVLRIGLCAG